jgi:hypothetical protein
VQETRHTANTARYLYGTPQGVLEFRALPTRTTVLAALIDHDPGCHLDDGCDCDAETIPGGLIALSWLAGDDRGVWYELAAHAVARDLEVTNRMPHEHSADERALIARLRAEGQRIADQYNN